MSVAARTWRAAAWLAGLTLVGLSVHLGASPAQAHADLVSSSPDDGTRLTREPTSIRLTFAGSLREPAYVVVTAPDGERISQSTPQVEDNRVIAPVSPAGQRGTYTVGYRVLSVDGHALSGELSYTVVSETTGVGDAMTASPPSTQSGASFWTGHWPHVTIAVGGMLVAFILVPKWRHRD